MEISVTSLQRLPKYLRVLNELQKQNVEYVSSTMVADELKLNSIQVRKDLAYVSKNDGKARVGFKVDELIEDIESFLDLNNTHDVIVVGAGRLGQALMNYTGFENNINIVMAFDNNQDKCDNKKIFHISRLENLVKRMNIHIAIVTVPKQDAQDICDLLVKSGIKGIWNFSPVNLKVPDNVKVRNEDLSSSLAVLLKQMNDNE